MFTNTKRDKIEKRAEHNIVKLACVPIYIFKKKKLNRKNGMRWNRKSLLSIIVS